MRSKKTEFQVGSHVIVKQVAEVSQNVRVVLLDGGYERGGEESDRVVGGGWREIHGGQSW